jgi:hypothetical protein
MQVVFDSNLVVIPIDKAIVVLTRTQFVEALKRGKVYRRQQSRQAREAPRVPHEDVNPCDL